jgi:pimeloyl-ACP methyl ester carboxylesterase
MLRLPTSRLRPTYCYAAPLILSACSAAGSGASADDIMDGTPMPPDVEAPASVTPTPTLPQAGIGSNPPPSRPPEDNPATGGLAPTTPPGGPSGAASQPLPAPTPSAPPETTLSGECCDDGDCLCHGPAPTQLTDRNGEFQTESLRVTTGTLFYPTDAEPPFAGLAIAAGFLNTGAEILDWGEFYASHGIVTLVTATLGTDFPDLRAAKLAASIDELQSLNVGDSPIAGQMSGRYGTSGYSMGGGGTTLATASDSTLLSSVGLAAWTPVGRGISTPTLLLCGSTDGTAPCSMSDGAYAQIPESTPKMMVVLPGVGHLAWLRGPTAVGAGGGFALAFTKLYLEGDERWRTVLLDASGDVTTNITE